MQCVVEIHGVTRQLPQTTLIGLMTINYMYVISCKAEIQCTLALEQMQNTPVYAPSIVSQDRSDMHRPRQKLPPEQTGSDVASARVS